MLENKELIERVSILEEKRYKAEQALNKLEGKLEGLLETLKKKYKLSSLEEGEKKLETMQKDLTRRQGHAEKLLTELETAIEEIENE